MVDKRLSNSLKVFHIWLGEQEQLAGLIEQSASFAGLVISSLLSYSFSNFLIPAVIIQIVCDHARREAASNES